MYSVEERQQLLAIARDSIAHGLKHGLAKKIKRTVLTEPLLETRASFVTLEMDGKLRGCIGALQAHQLLAQDVADNAYKAAFSDPRFSPLTEGEFESLSLHISVLTAAKAMQFTDEADVLAQLEVGVDGLILQDGSHRGTFLPTVWQSLTTPDEFFTALKQKAGLPRDYWSDSLQLYRYHTELID